jgi:shikimate kinase
MDKRTPQNLILIGMPGSGKSTLGVLLAKELGWDFLDTDLLIQHREGRRLQDILDAEGFEALRDREADALVTVNGQRQVIATGGSAVHRERSMRHLAAIGTVLYLEASLETVRGRIRNWDSRGIAAPAGTTLEALYAERTALYRQWAHAAVPVDKGSQEELVRQIADRLFG